MPTPTKGPRLGGSPAHERLMLANLATALFEHGRITTTEAKAKRLRPLAERLITFAKRGDLHARRRVMTVIHDKSVVHALFTEIGRDYLIYLEADEAVIETQQWFCIPTDELASPASARRAELASKRCRTGRSSCSPHRTHTATCSQAFEDLYRGSPQTCLTAISVCPHRPQVRTRSQASLAW